MTAREARLWELRYQQYLCAAYGPLCRAAGIENVAALSGFDCYALATAIQGAVRSRAPYVVKGSFGSHDYLGTLRAMSPSELSEMRERIRRTV
jgi:hypothetical protein